MKPPLVGRLLLRLIPLGSRREEVEGDLLELYRARAASRGRSHAGRRYLVDALSIVCRARIPRVHLRPSALAMPGLGQDAMFGIRVFAKRPAVVTLTILGLGLAIGVCGSVFSLLNAELLRSDGVIDSERAPRVMRSSPNSISTSWSSADYEQLRTSATLSTVHAWMQDRTVFRTSPGTEDPPGANVAFVDGDFLPALGARAASGRVLGAGDNVIGAPPATVVSHLYWTRDLQADPAIVGKTVWLGRGAFTIVGVANRGFTAPTTSRAAFWLPLATYHLVYGGTPLSPTGSTPLSVIARVKPNATVPAAEAELSAVANQLATGQKGAGVTFDVASRLGRPSARRLLPILAAVGAVLGLVLVLACVNVTTVLLASATTRSREMAVRLALGASRGRIVRQLLTESLLLGIASGAVGLALTLWSTPLLASAIRAPGSLDLAPDLNVFAFLTTVSMLAALGAGLAPSRAGARGDVLTAMKGASATGSAAPRRLRSTLIGIQAAASILLLVVATLLARATVSASKVDIGFDPDRLMAVWVGFGRSTTNDRVKAYWADAIETVRALPGVENVALTEDPPFGNGSHVMVDEKDGVRQTTYFHKTDAAFFDTAGLRVIRGRGYTPEEVATGAKVALITESAARRYWGSEDPLGTSVSRVSDEYKGVVIGIVRDAITARLRELSAAAVYQPADQRLLGACRLLVRTTGSSEGAVAPVTQAVRSLDPLFNVRVERVADGLAEELEAPRLMATVSAAMAIMALVLAGIGIYGITAAIVGQRTREIGVRLAIGADRRDVMRLLIGDSLRPVFVGCLVGIAIALLATRAIQGILFGVPPHDPLAFIGAATILIASAVAAVIVPARRAARVDPAFVLRQS